MINPCYRDRVGRETNRDKSQFYHSVCSCSVKPNFCFDERNTHNSNSLSGVHLVVLMIDSCNVLQFLGRLIYYA